MLPNSEQRSTDPLIATFEEDQKTTVFSALSEYLNQNLFCDVTLLVGHQVLRAHKLVLASSSKFFYNAFSHYPSLSTIDLERELAPHGISVTFDDVRLIIGILYCVGTVEISPPRIESLLLMAQIMGIPSLIRFLKRIKESLMNDESQMLRGSLSPVKKALVYVQVPQSANRQLETRSLTFEQHSTTSFFHTRKVMNQEPVLPPGLPENTLSPPSRSGSRATLASLSSFPFNPISSPALREAGESSANPQILDSLDPSFLNQLNNLQANQIDDLENALLPHLHSTSEDQQSRDDAPTSLQFKKTTTKSTSLNVVEDSFNTTVDDTAINRHMAMAKQEMLPLLPPRTVTENNDEMPKSCSTPKRSSGNLSFSLSNDANDFNIDSPPTYETMNMEEFNQLLPSNEEIRTSTKTPEVVPEPTKSVPVPEPEPPEELNQSYSNDLVIDEGDNDDTATETVNEEEANDNDQAEFKIPLSQDEAQEGKSITLTVPGSSKSFTLNFSADALNKMRRSVIDKQTTEENGGEDEVSSSTTSTTTSTTNYSGVKKKSAFACQLCSKCFPSKRMLAKHEKYHVDKNTSCKQCGQVFNQKWKLEQHIAKEHLGQSLECKECGKQFQWHRNLLAHINLNHVREIRYRCKNCPLTFLKKKSFILHHREKHKEAIEPWCSLCYEVFDGLKQREDHQCGKIENTGRITICHKHDPPMQFKHQSDLLEHIKTHHSSEENGLTPLQKSCPVCHKKFLLRKNLVTHMKRLHDSEGSGMNFKCQFCDKTFYYQREKEAHENTHTGNKNFKCHCGKAYSSKKALYDHTKLVHSETKVTYSCEVCGKVLRDKYKLKYHMMVHSEKRNFKCSQCSVEFKGAENLRKHVVKFHKGSIHQN